MLDRVVGQACLGEDLVPVVGDATPGPPVAAATVQPHRPGMRRREERLGGGGAPVDEQLAAVGVGEPEPADVDGLGVARGHEPAEAEVEAVAAQRAQPRGQSMDLDVAVHGLLAGAAGHPALLVEAIRQHGDRGREGLADRGEALLVRRDERGSGLGRETFRQGEDGDGGMRHGGSRIRG